MNPKGVYQASYQQRRNEKKDREKLMKEKDKKLQRLLKAKYDLLQKLEEDGDDMVFDSDGVEKHQPSAIPSNKSSHQPQMKRINSANRKMSIFIYL